MDEHIREIQKEDRKRCVEIIISCLREINSRNYSKQFIKRLVKSYKKDFMYRPEIYTIILEKAGNIIGTGSISTKGQIRDVFINVKNYRRGFGKKIVKWLEMEAKQKKIANLFLYSAVSAVNFYKNLGYIETEKLIHDDKDIEIRMEKILE